MKFKMMIVLNLLLILTSCATKPYNVNFDKVAEDKRYKVRFNNIEVQIKDTRKELSEEKLRVPFMSWPWHYFHADRPVVDKDIKDFVKTFYKGDKLFRDDLLVNLEVKKSHQEFEGYAFREELRANVDVKVDYRNKKSNELICSKQDTFQDKVSTLHARSVDVDALSSRAILHVFLRAVLYCEKSLELPSK